ASGLADANQGAQLRADDEQFPEGMFHRAPVAGSHWFGAPFPAVVQGAGRKSHRAVGAISPPTLSSAFPSNDARAADASGILQPPRPKRLLPCCNRSATTGTKCAGESVTFGAAKRTLNARQNLALIQRFQVSHITWASGAYRQCRPVSIDASRCRPSSAC